MNTKSNGTINFITLKLIEDVQIVVGKSVVNSFPMHVHKKFCIGFIEKGNALFVHNKETVQLSNGCIYLLNPDEAHQIKPADPVGFSHIVFCFGFSFIRTYFSEILNQITDFRFNISLVRNDKVSKGLIEFKRLLLSVKLDLDLDYQIMEIFSDLYPYCSFIQSNNINEKKQSENILKVCTYVKANCQKNISLHELAVYAGLSKFHFSRVFKNEVGISPYDYLIQSRLKLARDMLLNGQPLAEVALELGFTDQSHFSRFFRRNTGVPPAQFVKSNIEL